VLPLQVTNGDVTKNNPAWDLFKHDFWWVAASPEITLKFAPLLSHLSCCCCHCMHHLTEQLCVAAHRGQDITSSQSHKSYRPLTVLAFRLTHRFWGLVTAAAPGITKLLPALLAAPDSQHGKDVLPPGEHTGVA
jgi:hypothetical protein